MRVKSLIVTSFLLVGLSSTTPTLADPARSLQNIAQILGWQPSQHGCTLCGGYYLEPNLNPKNLPILPPRKTVTHMNADKAIMPNRKPWHFIGHVRLDQVNRQVRAGRAKVFFNKKNKPSIIALKHNVILREPDKVFVGDYGKLHLHSQTGYLTHAYYRFGLRNTVAKKVSASEVQIRGLSAWGKARIFKQTAPKHFVFHHASFTTCLATHPVWKLHASTLKLNKTTGRGQAYNTTITVRKVPVFYLPYFNFPIDGRRQSGFLTPTLGRYLNSGLTLGLPYYFNLAPNYDFTLTPYLMQERGVFFAGTARYLDNINKVTLNLYGIPYDAQFKKFKHKANQDYAGQSQYSNLLRALNSQSNTRGAIAFHDTLTFNQHFSGELSFAKVSDAYFNRDFPTRLLLSNATLGTQIVPSSANLSFASKHWHASASVDQTQTLEAIDMPSVTQPYSHVPQLTVSANYTLPWQLAFGLDSSFDAFDFSQNSRVIPTVSTFTGSRLDIEPSLSRAFKTSYAFLTPTLSFKVTHYSINHPSPGARPTITRSLPIISVDSGLYFDRDTPFWHQAHTWTIEPRVKYLYIPYRYQNDIPMFDSSVSTMTYSQLFGDNRFIGLDRIGDTNQITAGIKSQLTNTTTGQTLVDAGIGQIYLFSQQRVQACSAIGCINNLPPTPPIKHSPWSHSFLADYLTLSPVNYASLKLMSTYDPITDSMVNYSAGLTLKKDQSHILNFAYTYTRNGNAFSPNRTQFVSTNIKSLQTSFVWPLTKHVSALGAYGHAISEKHMQDYFLGIEYNACCWAVRAVVGRVFTAYNTAQLSAKHPLGEPQYDKYAVIQFLLRGLGAVGNQNPSGGLTTNITGYDGEFRHYDN